MKKYINQKNSIQNSYRPTSTTKIGNLDGYHTNIFCRRSVWQLFLYFDRIAIYIQTRL